MPFSEWWPYLAGRVMSLFVCLSAGGWLKIDMFCFVMVFFYRHEALMAVKMVYFSLFFVFSFAVSCAAWSVCSRQGQTGMTARRPRALVRISLSMP